MAICKWVENPVKQVVGLYQVTKYVSNKNKTKNPEYTESTSQERLIEYTVNDKKTLNREFLKRALYVPGENTTDEIEYFVTGIGCTKENAHEIMCDCQKASNKTVKNLAYHAIQSFLESPEEVSPKLAHEIGVKMAQELWGDEFVVLVSTHLNTGHCHNHFVICSTSPYTGRRFNKCDAEYRRMKDCSDKLCREYGLHIIEGKSNRKSKGEVFAEKKGLPPYRQLLKKDIDEVVKYAYSWKDFVNLMMRKGYTFRFGKTITVHTPYSERGIRLSEKLGSEYTYEAICRRIACKTPEEEMERAKVRSSPLPTMPKKKFKGSFNPKGVQAGIQIEYYRLCYHLAIIQKPISRKKRKRISPYLWGEIKKLNKYSAEMNLMCVNHIRTASQLKEHKASINVKYDQLVSQRQVIRNKLRRCTDVESETKLKATLKVMNTQLKKLRKEVELCNDILDNSERIIKVNNEYIKAECKQLKKNEYIENKSMKGATKYEY